MRSALLFLVHFKIFLGLQSPIGVLPHSLDIVWIFFVLIGFCFFVFCQLTLNVCADCSNFLCWLALNFSAWLTLDPLPSLLMMISYVECIFFWISWRLIEVFFQHDHCIKSTLWFWKFITLSWGSVLSTHPTNFDFQDSHLFTIRKVRRIVNHHMLRAYYLPSKKLTLTPKCRENSLNKTCGNWA